MEAVHLLQVRYVGATNFRAEHIIIESKRFKEKIRLNVREKYTSILHQAEAFLIDIGLTPMFYGEAKDNSFIVGIKEFKSIECTLLKSVMP